MRGAAGGVGRAGDGAAARRATLAALAAAGLGALDARAEVVVESPRWSVVKRRADGGVDFISPLPCPYNYGCVPGRTSGDGDPIDAVILGRRLRRGARRSARVVGVVGFVDAGALDPKVVFGARPLDAWQRAGLEAFFGVYAVCKRGLYRARGRRAEARSLGLVLG